MTDNPYSHRLAYIAVAAKKLEREQKAFHQAIRETRKEGAPLRQVAAAAGMSHEQVRRICAN